MIKKMLIGSKVEMIKNPYENDGGYNSGELIWQYHSMLDRFVIIDRLSQNVFVDNGNIYTLKVLKGQYVDFLDYNPKATTCKHYGCVAIEY